MSEQSRKMLLGDGISSDMAEKMLILLNQGIGIAQNYTTVGDKLPRKLLENVTFIKASITIMADSINTGTIYIGMGGISSTSFPLKSGDAITLDWINPSLSNLMYADDGTSGMILHVIG